MQDTNCQQTLATKYRPHCWDDVVGQGLTKQILQNQLETKTFKHAYLFAGSAGTGKTTCARLFANSICRDVSGVIELDAASHNSVDDIRQLSKQAHAKSLTSDYKVFILDECFPKNTKITMGDGTTKRIDEISVGDVVASMTGSRKVTEVLKHSVLKNRLCSVTIDGESVITTVDHLFFTDSGWVSAVDLKEGDIVYAKENMLELRKRVSNTPQNSEVLLSSMLSGVSNETLQAEDENSDLCSVWETFSDKDILEEENLFRDVQERTNYEVKFTKSEYRIRTNVTETVIRAYEEEQSNEQSRDCTEDVGYKREKWNTTPMERVNERGEWEIHNSTDSLVRGIRDWMGTRVSNTDKNAKRTPSISYMLQSRPRITQNETCSRGGWQRAQLEKEIIRGCKENKLSRIHRVESVEIYQRGNNDGLFKSCYENSECDGEYVTLYDLSVEGDYSYFANNILVHNCHSLSSNAWQAMLKLIEEPPITAVFIFCTTNPEKIPTTITSRVQKFTFSRLSSDEVRKRLLYIVDKESLKFSEDAITYITNLSRGGLRDAITMLDTCVSCAGNEVGEKDVADALGAVANDVMKRLTSAILDGDILTGLEIIRGQYDSGKHMQRFIRDYTSFVLEILKCKIGCKEDSLVLTSSVIDWLSGVDDINKLTRLLRTLVGLGAEVKWSTNVLADFEACVVLFISEEDERV